MYDKMAITGDHVRMLRGALRLTVREFAKICRVDKMTVSTLERGAKAQSGTQDKIREAFAPYVEFIEPVDGVRGAGIVMKWGIQPIGDASDNDADDAKSKPGEGLHGQAWDDDFEHASQDGEHIAANVTDEMRAEMREYLKTANMSDAGRAVVTKDFQL